MTAGAGGEAAERALIVATVVDAARHLGAKSRRLLVAEIALALAGPAPDPLAEVGPSGGDLPAVDGDPWSDAGPWRD